MNKKFKYLLIIPVLLVFILGFYLYKLHALAVDGNEIFEQRCLKVNPPLIKYKNAFLQYADALNNPNKYSYDEVKGFVDAYISNMRSYIDEENKWLAMLPKFTDRWDYRLFEPWYMKKAGDYQQKMYEGYRDDAKYLLEGFDSKDFSKELIAKQTEARDRRDKYSKLYFDFRDETEWRSDWRTIIQRVPLAKGCTQENITIPNTSGSINWEGQATPSATPKSIPFDSNQAG